MTADEVLSTMEYEDEESQDVCVIDAETRTISVPDRYATLGVESDEKGKRLRFVCPAVVGDNISLLDCSLRIIYRNGNRELAPPYLIDDAVQNGNNIEFSWLLSRKVTAYKGKVSFIFCAVKAEPETGLINNEWNTTLATATVLEGLEADQHDLEECREDIITQLLAAMHNANAAMRNANEAAGNANAAAGNACEAAERANTAAENANQAAEVANSVPERVAALEEETTKLNSKYTELKSDLTELETSIDTKVETSVQKAKDSGDFDGLSAYEHALKGGYTGTEEEFNLKIAELMGYEYDPITGTVDENNNIIISGGLVDGTYTIKYLNEDGTYTEIGEFDVGGVLKYTNLFDVSTALLNSRYSNSSGSLYDGTKAGYVLTGFIPVTLSTTSEKILRIRGADLTYNDDSILYFNDSKTMLVPTDGSTDGFGIKFVDHTTVYTDENGDKYVKLGYKNGAFDTALATTIYIKVQFQISSSTLTEDDVANIIITIDEPIVD